MTLKLSPPGAVSKRAEARLTAGISESDTGAVLSITVGAGVLFPDYPSAEDYSYPTLFNSAGEVEVVKVTGRSGDTFTIDPAGRGLDGTVARAWNIGDGIRLGLPAITLRELVRKPRWAGTASGTANALAVAIDPPPSALELGLTVEFMVNQNNTTAATLDLNGLGPKQLVHGPGDALAGGDLLQGQIIPATYDGNRFVIPTSAFFRAERIQQMQYVRSVAGGTADAITAAITPAPPALANLQIMLRVNAANAVVAPTLNLNGLGAKAIVKENNKPLIVGDLPGAGWAHLVFDSALDKWVLMNPALTSGSFAKSGGNISGPVTLTQGHLVVAAGNIAASGTISANGNVNAGGNVNALQQLLLANAGGGVRLQGINAPGTGWARFVNEAGSALAPLNAAAFRSAGGSKLGTGYQISNGADIGALFAGRDGEFTWSAVWGGSVNSIGLTAWGHGVYRVRLSNGMYMIVITSGAGITLAYRTGNANDGYVFASQTEAHHADAFAGGGVVTITEVAKMIKL